MATLDPSPCPNSAMHSIPVVNIQLKHDISFGLGVFVLLYPSEDTEEHAGLSKALAKIREVIAAVDLRVSEYERHQRLQEVWSRMENRSSAKLKNGHTFRKQDMMGPGQTLKHQGLLLWKTATGRLKGDTGTQYTVVLLL